VQAVASRKLDALDLLALRPDADRLDFSGIRSHLGKRRDPGIDFMVITAFALDWESGRAVLFAFQARAFPVR
jgi:hypothetical protein